MLTREGGAITCRLTLKQDVLGSVAAGQNAKLQKSYHAKWKSARPQHRGKHKLESSSPRCEFSQRAMVLGARLVCHRLLCTQCPCPKPEAERAGNIDAVDKAGFRAVSAK